MRDPSSDGKGKSPLAGVGASEAKSPADRIRQIQQLQQLQQGAPVEQAAANPTAEHANAQQAQPRTARRGSSDAFSVSRADAVKTALQPRVDPRQIEEVARRQVDDQALFVGSDVEVTGNPWKIIPFGDELPALFDTPRPLEGYEPLVPRNAVKTPEGLLFQVALKARDNSERPRVRTVLTDDKGKLRGAECQSPEDLQRLLTESPRFFETVFGFARPPGGDGVSVRRGARSRFEAVLRRPARGGQPESTQLAHLNNFGQVVSPAEHFAQLDFTHRYNLDAYQAGF